jgi:hypothetical protein
MPHSCVGVAHCSCLLREARRALPPGWLAKRQSPEFRACAAVWGGYRFKPPGFHPCTAIGVARISRPVCHPSGFGPRRRLESPLNYEDTCFDCQAQFGAVHSDFARADLAFHDVLTIHIAEKHLGTPFACRALLGWRSGSVRFAAVGAPSAIGDNS